jgi:hypothetical protein
MRILKPFFSLAAILLFISVNVHAQENHINHVQAPKQIKSYVKANFGNSKIIKAEYEVKLNNGIELEFDSNYNIKKIDSRTALPDEVIPKKIGTYVSKKYPDAKVTEWEKKGNVQEVELTNDLELIFDLKGNFLRMDD